MAVRPYKTTGARYPLDKREGCVKGRDIVREPLGFA